MANLIFQCFINSMNQTSTSPRLRSSRSSIMQAISRFRSIFVHAPFSCSRFVLIACTLALIYSACWLCLWKPNSKVDSMGAAVTFVRCTDTSTRPSFPRNHSWMPDKATTVDETCLDGTISALRRIAIPLDFILK
jgi:hypothetical protein